MLTLERIAYAFVHNQLALACLTGQGVSHIIPVTVTTFVHVPLQISPGGETLAALRHNFLSSPNRGGFSRALIRC